MTLDSNHSSLKLAGVAKAFGGAPAARGARVEAHEGIAKLSRIASFVREGVAQASRVPA
jgi:hypothetical protein